MPERCPEAQEIMDPMFPFVHLHPALRIAAVALACGAMLALAGCRRAARADCLTRAHLVAAQRESVSAPGLQAGTFHGQIVLPDRSNPVIGVRLTGVPCQTRIWRDAQGRPMAQPSYLDQPVRLILGESEFYTGLVDDGTALVVQQYPGGVTSTHTVFDANGVIVYGNCGNRSREFLRECHSSPR